MLISLSKAYLVLGNESHPSLPLRRLGALGFDHREAEQRRSLPQNVLYGGHGVL